jgi:hypothetical protein
VRVVGLLHRLEVYTPQELRMVFLCCRDAHLAELVAALAEQAPYPRLCRLTDVMRTSLFDIVT